MGMTIAEKILAKKGGQAKVVPGDVVTVGVDVVVLFDNNFMPSIWRDILKVHDPDRIIVALDHRVPAPNQQAAAAHRTSREFVRRFGIKRFHDVGPNQGISHQLVADHGYALPGSVLVCSDSHTCSAGVFNCLARGVGGPDVMYAATKGETWFRCGETIRYELTGKLSTAVTAKDAFLQIAGAHGAHATQNVEYGGAGLAGLSINARKTLTTMSAELSAEFATFEPDSVMLDWVRARNPAPFEPVYPDADASYLAVRKVDLGSLEPLVALPDTVVNNSQPVKATAGTRIDQAYIGSCANGTLDDLEIAARVVKGRQGCRGHPLHRRARFTDGLPRRHAIGRNTDAGRRRRHDRAADLRRLRRRAHGGAGAGRGLHYLQHAQLQGPHGRSELEGVHGIAGDGGRFCDPRRDHRSPRVPELNRQDAKKSRNYNRTAKTAKTAKRTYI